MTIRTLNGFAARFWYGTARESRGVAEPDGAEHVTFVIDTHINEAIETLRRLQKV